MSDLEVVDLVLSLVEDGEPRANIGEESTGLGFGSSTPIWAPDGFVGVPNAASGGACAQGIVWQDGSAQRLIAARDNRWTDKAGTLDIGDRAVVSDSEAWFLLTRATDRLRLRSTGPAGEMLIDVNGQAGTMTLSVGVNSIEIAATGITMTAPIVNVVGILQVGGVTVIVP